MLGGQFCIAAEHREKGLFGATSGDETATQGTGAAGGDSAQGHYHNLLCLFTCKDVALENPGGQNRPTIHMMEQVDPLASGPEEASLGCCLGCSALWLGLDTPMLSKQDEQKTQRLDPNRQPWKRGTFRLEVEKGTKRSEVGLFTRTTIQQSCLLSVGRNGLSWDGGKRRPGLRAA